MWEINTTTTESKLEQLKRTTGQVVMPKDAYALRQLTEKKHIQILTCSKCGKIKRYVTDI